jgi:uncharacterized protein (TIGR03437 family)
VKRASLLFVLLAARASAQTAPNWTRQIPQHFPSPRQLLAMAYDSAHGQVVLFGGIDAGSTILNETWVWDGSDWSQKSPQTSPPARENHAMAYDAAHGQVVLFGGLSPNGSLSDTWVWDGANWSEKTPQTSPLPRWNHGMAYDASHGRIVLFGGAKGFGEFLGDTWLWDGTNWTQASPQSSPTARFSHCMAYDLGHSQVVLFAGSAHDPSLFLSKETWVWDGTNWTQKSQQKSPPSRYYCAMVYDSVHSETLMFGGRVDSSKPLEQSDGNDAWIWDGANWTQESPQTSPPARADHAMAFDSAHGQAVLFGGQNSGTFVAFGDTWTWEAGAPPPAPPSIGSVVSASSYGGFPTVSPGSFVEIYGSALAFNTRGWTSADFTGNQAPTSLDGVEASIAGQKAFVNYIVADPGQVNVQLPSNIPTGAQQITVNNKNGTSAPFNVMVNATTPGLLAPASFKIGGKQYAVAFLADNVTYVLPAGTIAGIPSRPAKPGETIVLYGNGFGPVTPAIPAGELVQEKNQLAASLEVLFDQTPARLAYFGLSPGLVGVYQFNVVVPAISDNDLVPLTFKLGGLAGAQTLYTAVKK